MSRTKIDPAVRRMVFDLAQHKRDPMKYQCAGCRHWFGMAALEIDHIIPEADSTPEQRSDPDNLQLLCNPKGSTRNTSCHKAKTAREAAARAKANRLRKDYRLAWFLTGVSIVLAGVCWQYVAQENSAAARDWMEHSVLALGLIALCATAIQRFRYRRPRKMIQPAVEEVAQEPGQEQGMTPERIVQAAREAMGAKGEIMVSGFGENAFTLMYPGTGFADHEDDKRFDLLNRMQAKVGGRWQAIWNTSQDQVTFRRRPELARMLRHPGLSGDRAWHELPIAPGVELDLLVTPHVLIVGTTGAGKTALMRTLIVAVADSARRDDSTTMILADPKMIEMPGFIGWPGVKEVISEPEDLWAMSFDLLEEMRSRLRLIRAKKAKTSDFRKLIVVIDEYEQFFKLMDEYWKTETDEDGKPLKKGSAKVPPAISAIQSVLSMARKVNIHLIIGTQSPDAAWFGGSGTRENMSGRVAVGPVDAIRARMMFDRSDVGRDIPIEFKGRATVQVGDGAPQEVQCYYTPDPFDPDGTNTEIDWDTLALVGMEKP